MTMTDDAVRTYAVGDTVDPADYAGTPGSGLACGTPIHGLAEFVGGGACTMPPGHTGPQHVAAYGNGQEVCGIGKRDTSGDEPTRYTVSQQAPTSLRAEAGNACGVSVSHGYYCSLPHGHGGPQHIAIGSVTGNVYGVADVEPTPEPIVEQPTPEVLAERLAAAVEVNDNLDRQLRETRDELATVRNERWQLQTTHDEFRQRVVDTAMDLARQHNWCSVVQQGLTDMGLGDLLTRKFRVSVTVTATRTTTVEVEARDSSDAWRLVDDMGPMQLADLIDNTSPDGSAYRFYASDEWEHDSHDASTDAEEIDD